MRYSPFCSICRYDLSANRGNAGATSNWFVTNVVRANPVDLVTSILDFCVKYLVIVVLIANYNVVFDNKEVIDAVSREVLNYIISAFSVMFGVYFVMGIYYLVINDYVVKYENRKKREGSVKN